MGSNNLISLLKSNAEEALKKIYQESKPTCVKWLLKNNNINKEEALEIFQQSVVKFYQNIIENKLTILTSTETTYLIGICRNLVKSYLRERKKTEIKSEFPLLIYKDESIENAHYESKLAAVESALTNISKSCKELLIMFYYKGYSLKKIMSLKKYTSPDSVKTQKYKCLKRLRLSILPINDINS